MNHAVTVTIEVTPTSPSIHSDYIIRRYISSDSPKQKVDEINELLNKVIDAAPDNGSTIRAWRVQYGLLPPAITRTISASRAKEIMHRRVLGMPDYIEPISDESAIIVTEAPEFTWNSNLLPGDVYSLEHAEAGNKKPTSPAPSPPASERHSD